MRSFLSEKTLSVSSVVYYILAEIADQDVTQDVSWTLYCENCLVKQQTQKVCWYIVFENI